MSALDNQRRDLQRLAESLAKREALIERLLATAQTEAARDRSADPTAAAPWRFRHLIEDALASLKGAPLPRPLPSEARGLAARSQKHRKALYALAKRVGRLKEWNLAAARELEGDAAVLALWIAPPLQDSSKPKENEREEKLESSGRITVTMSVGGGFLPLIVRDGRVPVRQTVVATLHKWARNLPDREGRPLALGDDFDAAVMLLAQAYAAIAGRTGSEVFAFSLTNGANPRQLDAGPVARFIRAAVKALAPELASSLGPQSIAASLRRIREMIGAAP